jgi:TPR repeat protein
MKLAVLAAASALSMSAQDVDLASLVKKGEGWGTKAITTKEVTQCWATWTALREHVAARGRGSLPADYTPANLDRRIADWNGAMTAAFADYPAEQGPTSRRILEKVRGDVNGSGLADSAEMSGMCKTLPRDYKPSPATQIAAPAPAAAPASDENPAAWRARGRALANGEGVAKNPQQALVWTRKAAEAGNADAQYDLATYYYSGFAGLPEDMGQVMRWMKVAAEGGNATAQYNIGLSYYQGSNGYSKNLPESVRWFRRSAEQGDVDAQTAYGTSLWWGEGVAVNYPEAVRWFRKAADQGNVEGQFWLGNAYRRGLGVEFDVALARRWLRASAGQGDENAASMLRFMDEVDREFAQRQPAVARRQSGEARESPWKAYMDTMERQRRENCAAAAQGRNRVCDKW